MFTLKATHKPVGVYYAALDRFHLHGHTTEGNTRSAFADLLKRCAGPYDWQLVEEYAFKGTGKQPLRADGALVDSLPRDLDKASLPLSERVLSIVSMRGKESTRFEQTLAKMKGTDVMTYRDLVSEKN